MAYRMVREDYVEVIGYIWQPGCGVCAQRIDLREPDLENIIAERCTGDVQVTDESLRERFTRDAVEDWLTTNSPDFSEVLDFHATAGAVEIPWQSEDSEVSYCSAMYGDLDD